MELESSYSARKAANGSMREALRAGTYAARIEIAATARATTMKVCGIVRSNGVHDSGHQAHDREPVRQPKSPDS
jgi:hypothetical protein